MHGSSLFLIVIFLFTLRAFTQDGGPGPRQPTPGRSPAANTSSAENIYEALAAKTVAAHGGDHLTKLRSLIVHGSVEIGASPTQIIPANFMIVIEGERYAFELNNPIRPLKQVFDGQRMYSSGYELPPVTSLGFPLLSRMTDKGYSITAPANARKNSKKGFRVTTPDGFYTDFFVDEKTHRIKGYESSYDVRGRIVTTSVEIDEFQTVEGLIVPKRYSQRFDLGQVTVYAKFKTNVILINTPVADDVFAYPK